MWIAVPTLAIAVRAAAQSRPADAGVATTMPTRADDRGPNDVGGPDGDDGPHGGLGRGGPGGPMERRSPPSMDAMRGSMELVDRYTRLSGDAAGVSAVLAANDLFRGKGPEAIASFTRMLGEIPRPAVRRAIRLQLIDLHKAAGKPDLAIEQLEILMKAPIAE